MEKGNSGTDQWHSGLQQLVSYSDSDTPLAPERNTGSHLRQGQTELRTQKSYGAAPPSSFQYHIKPAQFNSAEGQETEFKPAGSQIQAGRRSTEC